MEKNELDKIKEEWKKLLDVKKRIDGVEDKISELEQKPEVTLYLELKRELEYLKSSLGCSNDNESIIEKITSQMRITNTTNIYVCISTYSSDYLGNSTDTMVPYNSKNASYRTYMNVEDPGSSSINVPIPSCKEFEKTHIVLIPPEDEDSAVYYNRVRNMYFKTAATCGQEQAVEKVKSIRSEGTKK